MIFMVMMGGDELSLGVSVVVMMVQCSAGGGADGDAGCYMVVVS